MMRFIDIRGQGTGDRFSWFNTITDAYVEIMGEQTWTRWCELEADLRKFPIHNSERETEAYIARLKGLTPEWAFEEAKPEELE